MDQLDVEHEGAREAEEKPKEKKKHKREGSRQGGRATKVLEVGEDSDDSRTSTVQVSNSSNRASIQAARQYPDANLEREVAREETNALKPFNLFGRTQGGGKRSSLLQATKSGEQLSREHDMEAQMRNTTAHTSSPTKIDDLKTSVFAAVKF